jgi:ATP-dependent Clp protease ATP-binding subunit ClpC
LRNLFHRVEKMGFRMEISEKAKDFIVEKGWDAQFGARPLKRAIQKYVEDTLAEEIIKSNLKEGALLIIDFDQEAYKITVKSVDVVADSLEPTAEITE